MCLICEEIQCCALLSLISRCVTAGKISPMKIGKWKTENGNVIDAQVATAGNNGDDDDID